MEAVDTGAKKIDKVVVHPLVLLAITDHYNRIAKDTNKRVVGVLLGEYNKGVVDVTNSYGVPFEEDSDDPSVWFLDHSFHEDMFAMSKRINAREVVVGWYSTGPKLNEADLNIDELIQSYCNSPVLVLAQIKEKSEEIPTSAYLSLEKRKETGDQTNERTFARVSTEVGAYESEEVGVEHLLRGVEDAPSGETVGRRVAEKVTSLKGLVHKLKEVEMYLERVLEGSLPPSQEVLSHLQAILNLLPALTKEGWREALKIDRNDNAIATYVASMARAIMAVHDLINNKHSLADVASPQRPAA